MNDQEIAQLFVLVFIQLIITFPICRIYRRAGFKWFWGLLTLVPLAGFFMIPGALGFTTWPSTTRAEIKSQGQHSLIWVAAFSALFWFGIPGADSQEAQQLITLISFIYITAGVAAIYDNAGYSRWGGIMGLLGITNLIWPWILAFRKWPTLEKIEDFNRAEEAYQKEQELELAEKFGVDPKSFEESSHSSSAQDTGIVQGDDLGEVAPPPIPKKSETSKRETIAGTDNDAKSESISQNSIDEDAIYEQIAAEISGAQPRAEGTYLRAEVEANGDPEKVRLIYTRLRKAQLFDTK